MPLTPRFKLHYFGGGAEGSLTENGMQFTGADRLTVDRVLAALERADHLHRPVSTATPGAVTGIVGTGGRLGPGQTYYYRASFLTADGLESSAGPEAAFRTPNALPPPSPPTGVARTGGSLAEGVVYYAVTAVRGSEESTTSDPLVMPLRSPQLSVELTLPPIQGAERAKVWRMHENDVGYTFIGSVEYNSAGEPVATFFDDGSVPANPNACLPEHQPPTINRGSYVYAISISLDDLDVAQLTPPSQWVGWRLYRTTVAGTYSSQSLVTEVTTRSDLLNPDSPVVTTYSDAGSITGPGQPTTSSTALNVRPFAFDSGVALPNPADYPEQYPFVVGQRIYTKQGFSWRLVGNGEPQTIASAETLPDPAGYVTKTLILIGARELFVRREEGWILLNPAEAPTLTSPNGSRYALVVADDGTLSTTPTTDPGAPGSPTNMAVS